MWFARNLSIIHRNLRLVHNVAAKGFHEENVQIYDKFRPQYPASTIGYIDSIICDSMKRNNHNSNNILELGAGTGKFTQSFLQHSKVTSIEGKSTTNNNFTATDPSIPFLRQLEQNIAKETVSPWQVYSKPGTGSHIPMPSSSASGVLAAQCYHWMSNDETLQEIARVCQPGAPFIMIWNLYDCSIDWLRRLEYEIVDPIYKEQEKKDGKRTPRFITQEWKQSFESNVARQKFHLPVHIFKDTQTVVCTEAALLNRVLSTSVVHILDDERKKDVCNQISNLLRTHPETRNETSYKVVYEVTVAHVCTK